MWRCGVQASMFYRRRDLLMSVLLFSTKILKLHPLRCFSCGRLPRFPPSAANAIRIHSRNGTSMISLVIPPGDQV